jgi:hypothetical protein
MAYAVAMNTGVAPKFILPNIFPMESRDIAGRLYAVAIPMVLWSGYPGEALDLLRKVRKYAHDANVAQRHVGARLPAARASPRFLEEVEAMGSTPPSTSVGVDEDVSDRAC